MADAIELAAAHLLAGEIGDALTVLTERLESEPDDDAARRLRGETLTAQHTPDSLRAALDDYARLAALTPDDHLMVAVIYERLGDLPRAARTLEAAVDQHPDHERLRQRWMEAAFKSGDLTTAQRAVQGLPDDWRMLEQAADLTAAFAKAPGAEDLLAQADDLYTMALVALPEADWTRPFRGRIVLARAGVNLRRNLPDDVARDADTAALLIPTEPACDFYRGWALVKRGSRADGLALVRRALRESSEAVRDQLWATIHRDTDFQDMINAL